MALHREKLTNLPCSHSMWCDYLIRIIMPNGDNIGVKSILVMSPIYMTSQSGALCISVTHFLEDMIFLVRESLTRIYEKCFKGLLSLVGYLVHLRHSWQYGENDKGPSMGSRIKRFEYRKFPLSGKWNCTQFCKITTGHGNTIENFANMMVFLLVWNFISIHAKTWYVFVLKWLFNYIVAPFYLVLITCSHYRLGSGTS